MTKIDGFEVFYMADISTVHITSEDSKLLDKQDAPYHMAVVDPVHDAWDVPGSIYWVSLDLSLTEIIYELTRYGFSEAFCEIFTRLHAAGIPYVRFDRDGAEIPGLPEFDW